ncbi:uncharacterized protein G2W53_033450 [Senna tora]|uniref:Uncharacterized protein n=1 Tax=Senna tora TaxID=362788 RepID=A0A834T9L1_9FABA|nr:uncharacterized protein G2W53_033450 [Senna tora]
MSDLGTPSSRPFVDPWASSSRPSVVSFEADDCSRTFPFSGHELEGSGFFIRGPGMGNVLSLEINFIVLMEVQPGLDPPSYDYVLRAQMLQPCWLWLRLVCNIQRLLFNSLGCWVILLLFLSGFTWKEGSKVLTFICAGTSDRVYHYSFVPLLAARASCFFVFVFSTCLCFLYFV